MEILYHRSVDTYVVKNDNRDFFVSKEVSGDNPPIISAYEVMSKGFKALAESEIADLRLADLVNNTMDKPVVRRRRRRKNIEE